MVLNCLLTLIKGMMHYFFFVLILLKSGLASTKSNESRQQMEHLKKAQGALLLRAENNLNKDLDSALWYSNMCIFINKYKPENAKSARAYSIKGEVYQKKADFEASIHCYLKSISLGEKKKYLGVLGSAYNGLGITYYMMNNLAQAEYYIRKALQIKMRQKDYMYYSIIASNLAALLVHKGKEVEALELLKKSEKIAIQTNLNHYLPNIYNSIGAIFYQMKDAQDSALYYYQKCIALAETHSIQQNMVTGYHNLGHLQLKKKQYDAALRNLKIAEKLAYAMNAKPLMLQNSQTLADTYEATGKSAQALEYRKKELELRKHIFDSEKQKNIEELQIQYETAEKDRINQEQEKKLLESELKSKKASISFYVLFFSTLFVMVSVLVVVYYFYQRRLTREKINREKIRIFENVVHDIRTPLTLIHGPLQELKSKFKSENRELNYFELINRNSEKLMRMVNELLDVSKIDKGKYQISWTDGNLEEYLKTLIQDFEHEAREKEILLIQKLDIPNSSFHFPKDVLGKIVFNLISNALKYGPHNSEIHIESHIEQNTLKFRVTDSGRGISLKEQAKIFERFYRLKEHQNLPGTGIGLAVVKEFVELIGGTIRVESEINRGACFEITLPIKKSQVLEEPKPKDNDPSKMQLLVCDDDADILTFIRSMLENDFVIHTASNGLAAIKVIEENAPDVILSDVIMPELDGIELLEKIKSDSLLQSIPVVLFSAKSALESRLKGLRAGADYYLPKPFNPEELRLILRNITNKIEKTRSEFAAQKNKKKPFSERLQSDNEYVNKALKFVIENIDNSAYSVNELAADMCISRSQLHRKLALYTGNSSTQFIRMIRLEKAKDLLESNFGNVEEVAFACGFSSRSYFSSSFTEYFGKAPTEVMGR
jgi:signal transduction histidine kinase/DNA-binding response OmpR family regulator/tetratricopeptide (TPR) repeat protein